jgi:hypothetical protein
LKILESVKQKNRNCHNDIYGGEYQVITNSFCTEMCDLPGKDAYRGYEKHKQKDKEFRAVEYSAQASAFQAGKVNDKERYQEIYKVTGLEREG